MTWEIRIVWKSFKKWRAQAPHPIVGQKVSDVVRTLFEAYWGLNLTFPKMTLNNPDRSYINGNEATQRGMSAQGRPAKKLKRAQLLPQYNAASSA